MNELITTVSSYAVAITAVIGCLSLICKPFREWFKRHFSKRDSPVLDAVKALSDKVDALDKKIDRVEQSNAENEKDRLKDEIFRTGNLCRRGAVLTGEEFRNLQANFDKYTKLGGNSIAHDEYIYVSDYYNRQLWKEGN